MSDGDILWVDTDILLSDGNIGVSGVVIFCLMGCVCAMVPKVY